jgi:hypothetical protein
MCVAKVRVRVKVVTEDSSFQRCFACTVCAHTICNNGSQERTAKQVQRSGGWRGVGCTGDVSQSE